MFKKTEERLEEVKNAYADYVVHTYPYLGLMFMMKIPESFLPASKKEIGLALNRFAEVYGESAVAHLRQILNHFHTSDSEAIGYFYENSTRKGYWEAVFDGIAKRSEKKD